MITFNSKKVFKDSELEESKKEILQEMIIQCIKSIPVEDLEEYFDFDITKNVPFLPKKDHDKTHITLNLKFEKK